MERTGNRYSWARLSIFFIGFVLSGLAFLLAGPWLAGIALAMSVLVFLVIFTIHGRIERSIDRFRIWRDIKRTHVARSRLDWEQIPKTPFLGEHGGSPLQHPLEFDLDLVGEFSLNRLADTAVSEGGRKRLREWLTNAVPDLEQSLYQQRLVQELVPRPLFRDKLTMKGTLAEQENRRWHRDTLLNWLKRDDQLQAIFPWLILSAVLAGINVSLFLLDILAGAPPVWQVTLLVYFSLFLIKSRELDKPFREASHLRDALEQLVAVFKQLEEYSYLETPNLKVLCASFLDRENRPSRQLTRVNQVVGATGIRGNPVFWLMLNLVLPWDFYFAYLTAKRKQEIASFLPGWMDTWFDIEALSSLANLAYLNPHYTFPDIIPSSQVGDKGVFQVQGLGHPLIPDGEKISNDFTVASLGEISLFTGSNMSGKSTFLRTVGINLILAYAGGPVDALSLRTVPFRVVTCIRISDSVTDGISYFYAEVKCLKKLLEELERDHPLPLFYFIDEIFRGTNNRERLLGSRAYIQALVGDSGVGLIATHDLELVQLADDIEPIKNYHFTDEILDGRMFFDYTLRPGPSPTTNALKIMQMEGLPIP
jgi:hypothetical protein